MDPWCLTARERGSSCGASSEGPPPTSVAEDRCPQLPQALFSADLKGVPPTKRLLENAQHFAFVLVMSSGSTSIGADRSGGRWSCGGTVRLSSSFFGKLLESTTLLPRGDTSSTSYSTVQDISGLNPCFTPGSPSVVSPGSTQSVPVQFSLTQQALIQA
ncbi:hypothetical protein NE237_017062 [Protea cynaroides]|uniref:Uncharacterized protein n=1 Tax=Protea cynaroides TaxID=273540 RepID=A0A9Q0K7B9_9MAGN|nr:hypothetical protein NE237_017062 [Protea cynaroides]